MKKKLMSAVALSMAMALTFGMTAFAAKSPDTGNTAPVITGQTVAADTTEPADKAEVEKLEKEAETLSKGVDVTLPEDSSVELKEVKSVTAGVLNNVKKVADTIAKKAIKAESGKTVVATPVAAVDVKIEGDIPEEGIKLTIKLPKFKRSASKSYMLLHLNEEDNVWETIDDAEFVDGKVTGTFKSLSPVVVVEVEQKAGETAPANNAGSSNNTSGTTTTTESPAVSPKTGETLPVAGLMTVICLAGVAVCAKKIRYNK